MLHSGSSRSAGRTRPICFDCGAGKEKHLGCEFVALPLAERPVNRATFVRLGCAPATKSYFIVFDEDIDREHGCGVFRPKALAR